MVHDSGKHQIKEYNHNNGRVRTEENNKEKAEYDTENTKDFRVYSFCGYVYE
ncbi:hypothetical protein [Methanolobus vulcani]|uniref:hypothetical protein n=1 Tax=Methanolobus vulcani TaxID=38026 RepID=UPI0012B77A2C|nr:hypothetical protein [Methanolobus vulcani]